MMTLFLCIKSLNYYQKFDTIILIIGRMYHECKSI